MSTLVSVVIPLYNAERFIAKTLDSVISQTFPSWEAVVVDDESSDSSPEIVQSYSLLDDRIRLIRQKNKGVGGARNTGLLEARGKYIVFLDADDLLLPCALEQGFNLLDPRSNCYGIMGIMALIDESGEELQTIVGKFKQKYFLLRLRKVFLAYPTEVVMLGNFCMVGAGMWRRDAIINNGLFDESLYNYGEDFELWVRLCAQNGPFLIHSKVVAQYRIVSTSNSRVFGWEFYQSHLKIIRRSFREIEGGDYDSRTLLSITLALTRLRFSQNDRVKTRSITILKGILPRYYLSKSPELLKTEVSFRLIHIDPAIVISRSMFRNRSHFFLRELYKFKKNHL